MGIHQVHPRKVSEHFTGSNSEKIMFMSTFFCQIVQCTQMKNWMRMQYRLAGVALLAPVVNYRWPGLPKNLSREAYYKQQLGDQWAIRVAYYAPWLLNWWMKQSWLPTSTVISGTTHLPNSFDAQIRNQAMSSGMAQKVAAVLSLSCLLSPFS